MLFRKDIQGLRALAFLMVLIFHINSAWMPGGFLGVDLFFVISGYLISTITLSDIERGKFSFSLFYLKRIKRIVPAYIALLIVVAMVGVSLYLYTDLSTLRGTVMRAALFVSNQLFAKGNSYFGAALSENPLLHTWSLAIEMQFYLILPFLLWIFRKKLRILLPLLIFATTFYSTYQLYVLENKSSMYFSLIARMPEFLVGVYFAVLFRHGIDLKPGRNTLLAAASLTVLLCCAFLIDEDSAFPGYLALIPCTASAILLVIKDNAVSTFFSNKVAVYLGEMSYSLYLWHWPVLAFLRYINDGYSLNAAEIAFSLLLTFILSWLSYTFIEKKLRKQKTKLALVQLATAGAALGVIYLLMPRIAAGNKISDQYAKPIFGLPSHYDGKVEKMGDLRRVDSILLIGDSHALMLKPFLDKIGKDKEFSFSTLTTDSYPAIKGILREEVPSGSLAYFDASRALIPVTDSLIKSNSIIILCASPKKAHSYKIAVTNLAKSLTAGQKLILIATFPNVTSNPLKVKKTLLRKVEMHPVYHRVNKKMLEDIANSYPNVYCYDVSKSRIFKNAPYIDDTVAYYNATHINTFGSLKLAEDLEEDFFAFLQKVRK